MLLFQRQFRQQAFPATRFNGRLEVRGLRLEVRALRLQHWTLGPPSPGLLRRSSRFACEGWKASAGKLWTLDHFLPILLPVPTPEACPQSLRGLSRPLGIPARSPRLPFGVGAGIEGFPPPPFVIRTRHRRVNFAIFASRFAGAANPRPDPGAPGLRPPNLARRGGRPAGKRSATNPLPPPRRVNFGSRLILLRCKRGLFWWLSSSPRGCHNRAQGIALGKREQRKKALCPIRKP